MATQVTNYQCPACTGPLHYSGSSGMLECDYCESKLTVEEVEALYAGQDAQAADAFPQEQEPLAQDPIPWDLSRLSQDWGGDGSGMRAYSCPSCGAELICDGTTAATSCPYCGNNTIVPGQLIGALKPDLILPFRLDKAAATAALKRHYQGKWLLPDAFSAGNHVEKVQGVYVPFWLYDAQVEASVRFQGINTRITRTRDYEITSRDHFDVYRRGTVGFNRVPVDASTKMADHYMDSLEPFDYGELKPFTTAYLPGYLAHRYDQDAEHCAQRADSRCETSALAALRETVIGYQEVYESGHSASIRRGQVHYALLPVWVLHTKWREQDYLFMMNGQTGKLVGDLPVDPKKAWIATAAATALCTVIFQLLNIGPAIASVLTALLGV